MKNKQTNITHLATGMNRRPVRMLAGFSSSGPNFRVRPVSSKSCAQDTDGFFEDEAAAGASAVIAAGAPLGGEAPAVGAAPKLTTGANGGGNDASGASSLGAAVHVAAVACAAAFSAELVASELLAD